MKGLITIFIIGLLIAVAFVVTKPTDQQCIDLMKSKMQTQIASSSNNQFINNILNYAVGVGFNPIQGGFRFEDNTFYKDVYLGNLKVGSAYFGTFSVDENFENAIARMREEAAEKERIAQQQKAERRRKRVEAVRSLFGGSSNNDATQPVGDDLGTVNQQLEEAYVKLSKLKRFHVLRTKEEKEQQIKDQEQRIQQLEQRKRELQ